MNISNYRLLNDRYINLFEELYDFKASFDFYVFHYLNRMAGVTGRVEFNTGKQKTSESKFDYSVNAEADLVFNIINKLRVTTGIEYLYTSRYEYNFSLSGGISYVFF